MYTCIHMGMRICVHTHMFAVHSSSSNRPKTILRKYWNDSWPYQSRMSLPFQPANDRRSKMLGCMRGSEPLSTGKSIWIKLTADLQLITIDNYQWVMNQYSKTLTMNQPSLSMHLSDFTTSPATAASPPVVRPPRCFGSAEMLRLWPCRAPHWPGAGGEATSDSNQGKGSPESNRIQHQMVGYESLIKYWCWILTSGDTIQVVLLEKTHGDETSTIQLQCFRSWTIDH